MTNNVTLFSNGIGHFRRSYLIPAGKEEIFSIPFKRDHIGDVAASLQVFGKVRLNRPPSFTPSNANATALRIDQSEALRSLLRSLSGAAVTVELAGHKQSFTLLGLETLDAVASNGGTVSEDYAVLMKDGCVSRCRVSSISQLHFDEESVRAEIEKALKNNFQRIKPDSTMLDMSVSASKDADGPQEAVIQYTIPVAAWKMRYSIRQDGDHFTLEGSAIIDNNTDEDWDDFKVSVVTGNPISFDTDIATVCVPQRRMVRLVDSNSLANVDVAEAHTVGAAPENYSSRGVLRSMGFNKMSSATANCTQFGLESLQQCADGSANLDAYYGMETAESAGVDSMEVGDFCVFTGKEPITILARKSAVVSMFSETLSKAGVVLLYKEANHARRPFRAVKFKNETQYSLGKGKTVIYNSGIFSGECVLETTKPGENRMLPHCLENGVKIAKESLPVETRRHSIRISDGVGVVEEVSTGLTKYLVENKKDESFKMVVEHSHVLGGSPNVKLDVDGVDVKDREKLATNDGHRFYFELAPKQSVTLRVKESLLNSTRVTVGTHWLLKTIIEVNSPLCKDHQVMVCANIQKEIDGVNAEVVDAKAHRNELVEQGTRLRANLEAVSEQSPSATVASWVNDLDTTEKEIRAVDRKTLPELAKKLKGLQTKLNAEIARISAQWAE